MNDPRKTDWQIVKRVFRYLASTKTLGINLRKTPHEVLVIKGFCDSDLGGDKTTGRSTSGNVLLVNNNPVLWKSKLQKATAISTMEAELYSLIELVKEISWFTRLCEKTENQQLNLLPIQQPIFTPEPNTSELNTTSSWTS